MHNSVCGMDRAGPLNCMRLMPAKLMAEIDSQTLVEGSTLMQFGEQGLLGFLKRLNCHLARDCRKLPEELAQ